MLLRGILDCLHPEKGKPFCWWAHGSRYKTGFMWFLLGKFISNLPGDFSRLIIQIINSIFKMVVSLSDRSSAECIGLNDIRTCFKILTMNIFDNIRTGNRKQVIISFQGILMILKSLAAKIFFG